jgi:hypothetical protein
MKVRYLVRKNHASLDPAIDKALTMAAQMAVNSIGGRNTSSKSKCGSFRSETHLRTLIQRKDCPV